MALGAVRKALADACIEAWPDAERVGSYLGIGMGRRGHDGRRGFAALHAGGRIPPLMAPAGMVNGAGCGGGHACGHPRPGADPRGRLRRRVPWRSPRRRMRCGAARSTSRSAAASRPRWRAAPSRHGRRCACWRRSTSTTAARSCWPFSVPQRSSCWAKAPHSSCCGAKTSCPTLRAWLAGSAVRCDASHPDQPVTPGQWRAAARRHGQRPRAVADIGYCNAHGTATRDRRRPGRMRGACAKVRGRARVRRPAHQLHQVGPRPPAGRGRRAGGRVRQ